MNFHQSNGVKIARFGLFDHRDIIHAVFTRHGGVSPEPWDTLNVGGLLGDLRNNVIENKKRAFEALRVSVESIYDSWQVHGKRVVSATAPRPANREHEKADAIITDRPGVTLFMRFADCVPILLYDPDKKAVGLLHAGWRGTVDDVVGNTVMAMQAEFGSKPGNILAGIGPSIGPDHYEVKNDVVEKVRAVFGLDANDVLPERSATAYFDLWKANHINLRKAGVKYIEHAQICTACHQDDWFSHRGQGGRHGAFGAMIAIR